jgi:hypothetical protein
MTLAVGGCTSQFVKVAPEPPQNFQSLGPAKGQACGSLGLLATAYYAIPLGLNTRVEKAYARALESVPGATALINVQVQENWYWYVLATARCVTVTGEAVK